MAADLRPHGVASIALWPGIVGTEHISEFVQERDAAGASDPARAGMATRYNWETPLFSGRVIAALAADPRLMGRTGKVQIVAELAAAYGLVQEDGTRPVTMRSLRFLLPFLLPRLQRAARWIPDLWIPWWLMLLTALSAPRL
jgi:NAD(P)-dependent dehydrogenase (short-subunit alcohol dehydrogenase family)